MHPGLAKGVLYPGSRCSPPWAKLAESPDRFFSTDDVPEIEYDDGKRKMTLQDPSRMKNHELTACLRLWQERQSGCTPAFRFHHWWSEGQQEYLEACEPKPAESDEEDGGNPATTGKERGKGKRKRKTQKKTQHNLKDKSTTNKKGANARDSKNDSLQCSSSMQSVSKEEYMPKDSSVMMDTSHQVEIETTNCGHEGRETPGHPGLPPQHTSTESRTRDTTVVVRAYLV